MNPSSERTKEALLTKTEALCTSIVDNRKDDPWGGDGYLSNILRAVKMQDATDYSEDDTRTEFPPALDYATSAQRELVIREQSAALVRTAQGISTLIRDLQELWLFGGLDTLSDPADEAANRTKALAVAEMIEALAKQGPGGAKQNGDGTSKKEETNAGS